MFSKENLLSNLFKIIFVISIIIGGIYFYKILISETVSENISSISGALIIILSIGLITLCGRVSQKIFLIFCAISFSSLYLAEIFVRLSEDTRSKPEVIMGFRNQNMDDVYGSMFPIEFFQKTDEQITYSLSSDNNTPLLPLSGIANSTNVQCREYGRENFGWVTERSDAFGFNNPRGTWDLPNIDVVFVGDSMTFSECVPQELGLVAETRKWANTLNLGMSGNDPLLELGSLLEFGASYKPKNVVWVFYENDLPGLMNTWDVEVLQKYLDGKAHQNLTSRTGEITKKLIDFHEEALNVHVRQLEDNDNALREMRGFSSINDFFLVRMLRAKLGLQFFHSATPISFDDVWYERFQTVLKVAARSIQSWGGQLTFVYLPSYEDAVYNEPSRTLVENRILAAVRPYADHVLNLSDSFDASGIRSMWQCPRCHYSSQGFRILSTKISNHLVEINR